MPLGTFQTACRVLARGWVEVQTALSVRFFCRGSHLLEGALRVERGVVAFFFHHADEELHVG